MQVKAVYEFPKINEQLRRKHVEPYVVGDKVFAYHLSGGYDRSTGKFTPYVHSQQILNATDLLSMYITAEQTGGMYDRFWRHFELQDDVPVKILWRYLDDERRQRILDKREDFWTPVLPGKLKRDYLRPGELTGVQYLEDGRIIAYKWLKRDKWGVFTSPTYPARWHDGRTASHEEPTLSNHFGIHCMKTYKNHRLKPYEVFGTDLVKLALSGIIVEAEEGFRAQYAEIIEIMREGRYGNR